MIPRYLINFDSDKIPKSVSDVLVIGSGIAGLSIALRIGADFKVTLLTKSELGETTTRYAQGGVAAAVGENDSPESHFKDTIEAGQGLCNEEAVKILVSEGPARLRELIEFGAKFDFNNGKISLSREGGHSVARVAHARGDATGSEIEATLVSLVRKNSGINIKENVFVLDLITQEDKCIGVITYKYPDEIEIFYANVVVLAAGGMGQLYKVTTNPPIATGDGAAMACRAGAEISDVEFIQFHPTAFYANENPRFLITEALRGEGAYLIDYDGNRFMLGVHPLAELAPRDIVTREMFRTMTSTNKDFLFLDATRIPIEKLKSNFPTIYRHCLDNGIDISKDMIPVAPAAHYMSGGVSSDMNGRTTLPGLYVCGESACTGVHGANRLASNSLLEGLVVSKRICDILPSEIKELKTDFEKVSVSYRLPRGYSKADVLEVRDYLQKLMTDNVGVVRTEKALKLALDAIESAEDILELEFNSVSGFELQNMILAAKLIARSAFERRETRGVHFREDFPLKDDLNWKKHSVLKLNEGKMEVSFRGLVGQPSRLS
ncbi:MAG: L-aspartate oxidase [Actinobacteria bacterium]|nr:L-aspartate oxidase [Actinomycetota bacterium]